MSLFTFAETVLNQAGCALDAREIARRIIAKGLWRPITRTPDASVGAAIYVGIKNGERSIVKVGKGLFASAAAAKRLRDTPRPARRDGRKRSSPCKKSAGYVYILVNPSLKGMVKIGKTKRPVDLRSKELYNTAIPTQFEEYASLETGKYAEVEELVHRILTKLTRKRVNEKREFYKIRPDEALEILTDVSRVLDPGDRIFHAPATAKAATATKSPRMPRPKKERWTGKTQLAKIVARRGGNEGAFGGILHLFDRKRRCVKDSKWREPLERIGIRFDARDFVIDWSAARNPL